MMYTPKDELRRGQITPSDSLEHEEYRTPWRRDFARLIHCPSFRRLQGKTQLYPGVESDFFRNRLTHSLEVAQIAKSIAIRINNRNIKDSKYFIDLDLVEFAGLSHDLGHPPFGHQGEEALDECMIDCGGFEGNAQTLRILSKLEKRSNSGIDDKSRQGLNLTYRSLASVLKYDNIIPVTKQKRLKYAKSHQGGKVKPVKGFYAAEEEVVSLIKKHVCKSNLETAFKTVECQIMDIADDIAYSTYDLEDGFKAGFFNPLDIVFSKEIHEKVYKKINQVYRVSLDDITKIAFQLFQKFFPEQSVKSIEEIIEYLGAVYYGSKKLSSDGYFRTNLTSNLVGAFIRGVEFNLNKKCPALSKVELAPEVRIKVELLKTFTYESQILSPRLKIAEYRGKEIVKKIFESLINDKGFELLPGDYRLYYDKSPTKFKKRIICDFISGMTDKYAIEFYGRLTSEKPETIFKPF